MVPPSCPAEARSVIVQGVRDLLPEAS